MKQCSAVRYGLTAVAGLIVIAAAMLAIQAIVWQIRPAAELRAPPEPPARAVMRLAEAPSRQRELMLGPEDKKEVTAATEAAAPPPALAQRKIITTGQMEIEVRDLDEALATLARLVEQMGGFIAQKSVTAEEQWRRAEITIRVPAENFQKLHDGAHALGIIKRDEQQTEDITKQWQDLEARIKIHQAEEKALLQLLAKQARLKDLLDVEQRLWDVREQIEQAQSDLRRLKDQVTLATLNVTLREIVPAGGKELGPWNLAYHIQQAAWALVRIIRALMIGLIYAALPGAIIWAPVALLIRVRRMRQR